MNAEKMTPTELRALADQIEQENKIAQTPKLLENIDYSNLRNLAERIIDEIANDEYDDDNPQWCYEQLLMTVYGDDVFSWINENQN